MLSGITRTQNIPVTFEQLYQWEIMGMNIQTVMPDLTDDQREFIMTGITPDEWDENMFVDECQYYDDDEAAF